MKNFEKYKTPDEQQEAHYIFCAERVDLCRHCPCSGAKVNCDIVWLFLDENNRLSPEDREQCSVIQNDYSEYRRVTDWHRVLDFFDWYWIISLG